MLTDIFSSFDPIINSIFSKSSILFWSRTLLALFLTHSSFWVAPSRISSIPSLPLGVIYTQARRTFGHHLKRFNRILSSLFLALILINLIGLVPYTFSSSRHLILTIAFGIPLWLSLILSSLAHAPKKFAASLLPPGAPDWLNPFLILVETISTLVRPLTLSFRLAANIRAGHIVITLLGIFLSSALLLSSNSLIIILLTQIGYMLFEVGICLIQAYIFCLLITLYADDHSS